jgi:Putative Ig domain
MNTKLLRRVRRVAWPTLSVIGLLAGLAVAAALVPTASTLSPCTPDSEQRRCAPTSLSYPTPAPFTIGQPISPLTPTVKGIVLRYAVVPALPAGLTLSRTTGVISGTPSVLQPLRRYLVVASNKAGIAVFVLKLSVVNGQGTGPTALSYPSPQIFVVGRAITPLVPTVTGSVTQYSVQPALPAGLSLNAQSGQVSGTPSAVTPVAAYLIAAANGSGQTSFALQVTVDSAPTIHLVASAGGGPTDTLTYVWKTTDGQVLNANGPVADWLLPPGPGLHFAYVLVSNGKGSYTERRVVVSTDDIGSPAVVSTPANVTVPAAPVPVGNYFRAVARQDAPLFLVDPVSGTATTSVFPDARGFFTIPMVLPGTYYVTCDAFGGLATDICGGQYEIRTEASQEVHLSASPSRINAGVAGHLSLTDGSPCGTLNAFFGVESTANATLLDPSGVAVAGPIRVNSFGNYQLFYPVGGAAEPALAAIQFSCEGAAPTQIAASFSANAQGQLCCTPTVLGDSATIVVSDISATFNGASAGKFLSPFSGLTSDRIDGSDHFLAFKGIDSRESAWRYYKTIGAIQDYNAATDVVVGGISFDDWKRQVGMQPFAAPGVAEYVATYVNRIDLNLTRNHHSISYGPNQTAAYVCNYAGPTADNQAAVDLAIDNAVNGRNLVACVAMDYGVSPGVNGNMPFTRFLIFAPSGQLLPSVNLDGRGEKFVPGTCVVCHGGDRYAGSFPADGSGSADIGAHFVPYDSGNFSFSSRPGLTETDLAPAIHALNLNVLNAGPTTAEMELLAGWYASGTDQLNKSYLPASWQGQSAVSQSFYTNVYARSCRTCHVAMSEPLNYDHYSNMTTQVGTGIGRDRMLDSVCSNGIYDGYTMPNSLRTFDLFWGTAGGTIDQPLITQQFLQEQFNLSGIRCLGPP